MSLLPLDAHSRHLKAHLDQYRWLLEAFALRGSTTAVVLQMLPLNIRPALEICPDEASADGAVDVTPVDKAESPSTPTVHRGATVAARHG